MKNIFKLKKKICAITVIVMLLSAFTPILLSFTVTAAGSSSESESASNIIKNDKATIDLTDTPKTGSVVIKYNSNYDNRLKVQIIKDDVTYNYDLKSDGSSEIFPLQLGDGEYTIRVMAMQPNSKYAVALTTKYTLKLDSAYAPFLNPNQYVNYNSDSKTVAKANELVKDCKTDLEKVQKVYSYIVANVVYDTPKAQTVTSGYLPVVDEILKTNKGICFDYASLLAAMLRSLGIPTKLVIGWVTADPKNPSNKLYHAWNEFYIEDMGWFKINEIVVEGGKFSRVDSTFDASSNSNAAVIKLIGDGSNYDTANIY